MQQVVDAEAVREAGENRSASAIGVTTGSQPASRGREQSGTFHTQGSDASRRASAWAVASGSVPDAGTGGGAPSVGRTPSVKSVATASHASELGGEHSTRVASIAGMTARRKDSGGAVPVAGSPQRGLQFNFHGLHVSMDDDDEPSGVERMAAVWERTALGADGFRSTMQTEDATLLRVVHYDWEHGQHRRATQLHYGGGLGGHFSGLRRRIRLRADEGDNMSNTPTSSRPTTPTRTATVLSEPAHAVGTPGSAGAARTGTRGSHRSVLSRRSLPSAAVREAMDLL
ncbi:hypothetical protein EON62_05525 [archaeon]|nr:MAG: hypothetical protein EON62_05525 [archaeon]